MSATRFSVLALALACAPQVADPTCADASTETDTNDETGHSDTNGSDPTGTEVTDTDVAPGTTREIPAQLDIPNGLSFASAWVHSGVVFSGMFRYDDNKSSVVAFFENTTADTVCVDRPEVQALRDDEKPLETMDAMAFDTNGHSADWDTCVEAGGTLVVAFDVYDPAADVAEIAVVLNSVPSGSADQLLSSINGDWYEEEEGISYASGADFSPDHDWAAVMVLGVAFGADGEPLDWAANDDDVGAGETVGTTMEMGVPADMVDEVRGYVKVGRWF